MPVDFPDVLTRVLAREELPRDEAQAVMTAILAGDATPSQIAGFLVAMRAKDVTAEEMTGLVNGMLGSCVPVTLARDAVDTCGTGGSEQRRTAATNVSTFAALVAAGAGAPICKHGNRRASATTGSADTLEALGVVVDLDADGVARCVEEAGMGFCFAPRFHPGMRHAGPVRRELGVRTIFNFLGPLANPARVRRQVIGVADPAMADKVVAVLRANGAERAMVVYGHDGLDELTTTTTSTVVHLRADGSTVTETVDAAALGLRQAEPDQLRGGDTDANVRIARHLLDGERIAHRDLVLLNAAAAIVVAGLADDLAGGLASAERSIDSGAAAGVLEHLVEVSKAAAAA